MDSRLSVLSERFRMNISRALLVCMLLISSVAMGSSDLVAQDTGENHVSSGTIIAAAFESMGYAAQQQVLEQMSDEFAEIGGLIYLGVLLSAVLTAGLLGSYAPALWLLVGPPLFIFVSGVPIGDADNRVSVSPPQWQFGAFKGDDGLKNRLTRGSPGSSNVSFVFHSYNNLISEIYQKLISEITADDIENQLLFMARQRILEDLFAMQVSDPDTKVLMGYMFAYCSNELVYAQHVARARRRPELKLEPSYQNIERLYCDLFPRKNRQIPNRALTRYLKESLQVEYEHGDQISCLDLWNWTRIGLGKDIANRSQDSLNRNFGPEVQAAANGADLVSRVYDDILTKLEQKEEGESSTGDDPCPFPGIELKGVVTGIGAFETIANIFTGLLVRKEQTSRENSTVLESILEGHTSGFRAMEGDKPGTGSASLDGDENLRRQRAHELGITNQYEAFFVINFMPYFQAILLYVLSVTFPFFALLLLVPGQAGGFGSWLALWAWVKSWDVGWALVMVTDKLLWEIMPPATFYADKDLSNSPLSIMEMHFSGDYSYSATFYWVILASLITAVPVITAQAILGAKRAFGMAFIAGVNDVSNRLSAPAQNYARSGNVAAIVSEREGQQVAHNSGVLGDVLNNLSQAAAKFASDHSTWAAQLNNTPSADNASKPAGIAAGNAAAESAAALEGGTKAQNPNGTP